MTATFHWEGNTTNSQYWIEKNEIDSSWLWELLEYFLCYKVVFRDLTIINFYDAWFQFLYIHLSIASRDAVTVFPCFLDPSIEWGVKISYRWSANVIALFSLQRDQCTEEKDNYFQPFHFLMAFHKK